MANIIKGIAVPFVFDITGYPASAVDDRVLHDSIFTILNTTPGERVMRPSFGSWLRRLVFDNLNILTAIRAEAEIRRAIREWEPRVTVQNVLFELDESKNAVVVNIDWSANGRLATTIFSIS